MSSDAARLAEFRSTWRRNWLGSIVEFADYDLQRKSWLGGAEDGSPYWSFVEWMSRYFDDQSLSEGYEPAVAEGLVSEEEAAAVSEFHSAASSYAAPRGDDYDHSAILDDPAWRNLVALADAARLRLLDIIPDADERTILQDNDS